MAHAMLLQPAMTLSLDEVDGLTERIIGCAIEVHRKLGPGLLESVYRDCLVIELRSNDLSVVREHRIDVDYKGHRIAKALTPDLLVEDAVIIEVKAVERLHPVHMAQLITHLKLTGKLAGLLMNFNALTLRAGLKRARHPDLHRRGREEETSTSRAPECDRE